jgi:hypothetical protein
MVEARDLFLNLPVRRGFLGTVRAEANATYDNRIDLQRPSRPRRCDDGAAGGIAREKAVVY